MKYTQEQDFEAYQRGDKITYGEYVIVSKKDFTQSQRAKGEHGWEVTRDGLCFLPGATWGRSIEQALRLADCCTLVEVNGEIDSDKFWAAVRIMQYTGPYREEKTI